MLNHLRPQTAATPTPTTAADDTPTLATPPHKDAAVRWFLYSAIFWLAFPGLAGLLMAVFLYLPSIHDGLPVQLQGYLQFGRLRPMHVNVFLFGWLSMAYAGAMLFMVPRLTRTRLFSERLGLANVAVWNATIAAGMVSLLLGFNQGREYAELAWPVDLLMLACFAMLAVNVWGTVLRRQEKRLYISVWSFMASSLIIVFVYGIGNVVWDTTGALRGMNDAILNYFYVHNLFNVWFTTGAIGLVWYLLPRMSGNPLWSYRLAIWGFTSVWTGQHHLLYGPGPEWLELLSVSFSILTLMPNIAFVYNFVKTMEGAWGKMATDVPLRFLATGCVFYAFTCFQGVAQSFRFFNAQIHFTNWVIGHSHLAFVAAFSFICLALIYHLLPRILGRELFSRRLMEWHYWLVLTGIMVFMLSLWTAGWIQGGDWLAGGTPFMETVEAMKPFMLIRLLAGLTVFSGMAIFVYSVALTLRTPKLRPTRAA